METKSGLSRGEFIVLVGATVPVFEARVRRDQLPWGSIVGPRDRSRWYSASWALSWVIADAMHDALDMKLDPALKIARGVVDVMWPRLPEVRRTATELLAGRDTPHIMCGAYRVRDVWFPICSTVGEMIDQHRLISAPAVVLVSMTACAAVMIGRAEAAKIDLGGLWQ